MEHRGGDAEGDGLGRQWVTAPSLFPLDNSPRWQQLQWIRAVIFLSCWAERTSLQKHLGRSAFLTPGSAQGPSWGGQLVELLRDAERWQVWGLPNDPLAYKGGLRRAEWIC